MHQAINQDGPGGLVIQILGDGTSLGDSGEKGNMRCART